MTGLFLTFPNNTTINVEYITNSLVIKQNYYKSLKPVDNSCNLSVIYNTNLANMLKLYADENITANVYDNNNNLLFAGYLRKSFTFNKTQKNQPIAIEVVSPSYLLDKELTTDILYTNETVGIIINALGAQADFILGCSISNRVDFFYAKKGEKIKDIITNLLFEYGFTYDFNNNGAFITYPLFNQPDADNIAFNFTGSNCLSQIQIQRTEKQYTGVTAQWQKKEFIQEALLYEDTQGATTAQACSIEVAPRSYMYGNDNTQGKHYLNFDSTKGSVLYASNIWLVKNGTYIENLQTNYQNCGTSVLWSAYNPSQTITATYHKFQWWGRAWVATSENETKTTVTGDKSLELKLSYLNDNTTIADFIKKVADYYRYSLFNVAVKSKADVNLGAFVTVSDSGLGTITGRVISKQKTYLSSYNYTIESVADFTPAELSESSSAINKLPSDGMASNIAAIKSTTDSLQQQIDNIEYSGTTCALDLSAVSIEVDDEGFTQTAQSFVVYVTLQRNNELLPFIIGNDENPFNLPAGWSAEVDKDKITFTIDENVQIKSGAIKIPVIYTPIISNKPFVDENGTAFVDEEGAAFLDIVYGTAGTVWNLYLSYLGNGYGRFLHTFTTVSQIENCSPNISDYFVWGGTNNTTSDLIYGGVLKQAQVYKYIGNGKAWGWEIDENAGHIQAALSDVLAISNADLEHNNSDVWEYLNHFTANSAYIGLLTANEAFIDSLTANEAFIEQLSTDIISTKKLISGTDLGFSESDTDYTIIENGKIKTNRLDANIVTTDEITSGSGTFTGLKADEAEFTNAKITGTFESTHGYIYANIFNFIIKEGFTTDQEYLKEKYYSLVSIFGDPEEEEEGIRKNFITYTDGAITLTNETVYQSNTVRFFNLQSHWYNNQGGFSFEGYFYTRESYNISAVTFYIRKIIAPTQTKYSIYVNGGTSSSSIRYVHFLIYY